MKLFCVCVYARARICTMNSFEIGFKWRFFFSPYVIHMWIIRGIVFHYYTIYGVTNENHVIVRLRALVSIKVWPVRILHFLWNFHAIFFLFSFLLCCWDIRIAIDWAIKSRSQCNYNFDSTSRSLSINRQIGSIEFISLEFIYIYMALTNYIK